jgi:hypothetical protein
MCSGGDAGPPFDPGLRAAAKKQPADRLGAIVSVGGDLESVRAALPPGVVVRRVLKMAKALAIEGNLSELEQVARLPGVTAIEPDRTVSSQ